MLFPNRRSRGLLARCTRWFAGALAFALAFTTTPKTASAQTTLSVAFTRGFIGATGSNAGQSNAVSSFATLGISRIFFLQSSTSSTFQIQGNDIPGTIRVVGTNGTSIDLPGSAVWRQTASGNVTYLVGFIPRLTSNVTWDGGAGTITFRSGEVGGGTNIGAYFNSFATASIPNPLDGTNQSGDAARTGVLAGLNEYLTEVNALRPLGPVNVNTAPSLSGDYPSITGTVTLRAGEVLTVVVNGVQYPEGDDLIVDRIGGTWQLALPVILPDGTYNVAATITNASGYTLNDTTTGELTVGAGATPLTIGGSFTASDKVYDRTTAATIATNSLTLSGSPAGVAIGSVTLAFGSATVGNAKTVTITGMTLVGTNASSYSVNLTGAPTTTASITPKTLTVTGGFTAANKTYDRTTAATITGNTLALSGVVSGDAVTVGTPTAAFGTATVGTAKTVSLATLPISGLDNANYTVSLAASPTTTANITAKALTIGGGFTAANKVYDANTSATITSNTFSLTGVVSPDVVTLGSVTATFADAAAANGKTVSVTAATLGGADAANYSVSYTGAPTTTANITRGGTITVGGSFTANNRVYNGNSSATGTTTGLTLTGVNSLDDVSISTVTLAFGSKSVADGKTVSITNITLTGAQASLYTVDLTGAPTTTANITPKALTIGGSFTAANKTYDANTSATISGNSLSLTGVISPDVVSLSSVTATFADATPANGKTVSLSAPVLDGTDAANYTVSASGAPTTTANITRGGTITLSGSFTANSRVYDGTTGASGNTSGLALSGVNSLDDVSINSVTLAFANKNVGQGKTVSIVNIVLTGAQASLYTVNLGNAPTALANITPRVVTIGGSFGALDKLFDGDRSATITDNALVVLGALTGDALSLGTVVVEFVEELVGNRTVRIASAQLQGTNAANYQLSLAGSPTTTANITALDPPGAPRNLTGTPGDGRLTVSFTMPLVEGCRPVDRFLIEYSADNGATWTRRTIESRTASPYEIAPVTNNVTYRVRVAAANACGMGPWVEIGDLTPIAPTRTGDGTVRVNTPGTTTVTSNGTPVPVTITVVEDTTVKITSPDFTLAIRSVDTTGAPVPAEGLTLQLEQGGTAYAAGTGFGPGTWVSIYIYGASGEPRFLGKVLVQADGSFATSFPVPSDLAAGSYTLQVNGVDAALQPRSATLGVEVIEPVAEPVLLAVPDRSEMTVGDTVTFTLTVTNGGRGAAVNVVIPRAFDEPGFRFVNATPVDGTFDASTLTWTIPRIAAGGAARLTLRAVVLPPSTEAAAAATGGALR